MMNSVAVPPLRLAVLLHALAGAGALLWAKPALRPPVAARRSFVVLSASEEEWAAAYARLVNYRARWGTADATLSDDEGRWLRVQRRLRAQGKMPAERARKLESLGVSWSSPSDVEDPLGEVDWVDMCTRLEGYIAEHGDGQVPKKYKLDPALGGWVAACRRKRLGLGTERVQQLDALGFEWVSTARCGSKFMLGFRKLSAFHEAHGHSEVERVGQPGSETSRGEELSELRRWCDVQRAARSAGLLSEKRVEYLDGVGFRWGAES